MITGTCEIRHRIEFEGAYHLLRMRRVVVMTLIIAFSGIVPLIASANACANMPCCHHRQAAMRSAPDCCLPATSARQEQVVGIASAKIQTDQTPLAVTALPLQPVLAIGDRAIPPWTSASPPPSSSERLSILSILLI